MQDNGNIQKKKTLIYYIIRLITYKILIDTKSLMLLFLLYSDNNNATE
jgi:hypothetical protein